MAKETIFALVVSLLTWAGVWAYLLRLEMLTRALERQARALDEREPEPRDWADGMEPSQALREEAGL